MSLFSIHLAEDRRLVILRVLLGSAQYTANEFILQTMAERWGHVVSAALMRTDLAWLHEQGLAAVQLVGDVTIARLTVRGEDAARGRVEVPGVKRPRASDVADDAATRPG
jgi:hypothetical protein